MVAVNLYWQAMIYKKLHRKPKDRATWTSLKTRGELRCSGRVGSSCSISDTRRVTLVTVYVMNEERTCKYLYIITCIYNYDKWNLYMVICDTDELYHIMLYHHNWRKQDSNSKNVSGALIIQVVVNPTTIWSRPRRPQLNNNWFTNDNTDINKQLKKTITDFH